MTLADLLIEEGRKEGLEKGLEKGRQEGRAQGILQLIQLCEGLLHLPPRGTDYFQGWALPQLEAEAARLQELLKSKFPK